LEGKMSDICEHGLPIIFGCPQCEIENLRSELSEKWREKLDWESRTAIAYKRIEWLERLAALYADGNQIEAHRAAIALGLEDDDE